MIQRDFAGKMTSVLALGTADFGGACPESRAHEYMDAFWEIGGRFIDSARVYGDFVTPRDGASEEVIGRWVEKRGNRESAFLSTKGGHPRLDSMHESRLSRAEIHDDMMRSLDALRTGYVDIYWLHRDDISRPVGEIMESLQALVENGSARRLGASNWTTARIRAANEYAREHGLTPFAANQPQFSLAQWAHIGDDTLVSVDGEMHAMHEETGMILAPFSSQGRGFFSKLDQMGADNLPGGLKKTFLTEENLAVYGRMKLVQKETGYSMGAIAVAWLTAQPFPVFPLVGVSRMEHIEALKEAGEAILTPEQRDFIRKI